MKNLKRSNYFVPLCGVVLFLFCISPSAYASSDDELRFSIYPPDWPQPYPVLFPSLLPFEPSDSPDHGGQINLEDIIDLDVEYVLLPEQPRFNGVPPIDIDGAFFDAYALSNDEPIFGIEPWFGNDSQAIIVIGEDDGVLEYLLPPDRDILPYPPRFDGTPPLDIDGSLFDSYSFSGSSYEPASSFITPIPEPATLLLLTLGAVMLRRKR